jgi:hypothetical protein
MLLIISSCKKDEKLLPLSDTNTRGTIVRIDTMQKWDTVQVDSFVRARFGLTFDEVKAHYNVMVCKMVYNTIDPFGNKCTASGVLIIPENISSPKDLCSYQHGTIMKRNDVPSTYSSEFTIGLVQAANGGFVSFETDYIGLGESNFPWHPYIHAESEANSVIDMYRAVKRYCANTSISLSGEYFIFGYSQGGHSTMATHKAIEEKYSDEIKISASACMSGPYDVSGYQADIITSDNPYPAPYYLPYILFTYNKIYRLYDNDSQFLKSPYDVQLPPLYLGNNDAGIVDDIMPDVIKNILQDSVITAFDYYPNHPFREKLKLNDLYNWLPKAPMLITYCKGDRHVVYKNALVAYNSFRQKGKTNISLYNGGDNLDHGDCVLPTLFRAKAWLDSVRVH